MDKTYPMTRALYALLLFIVTTQLCGCSHLGMQQADILILHMGSSATPKMARRLERLDVSYTIFDGLVSVEQIRKVNPKAIIITGSPQSVLDVGSSRAHPDYFNLNIPILGLCYGMQMIAEQLGGKVKKCSKSEKEIVLAQFNGKCGINPEGLTHMHVLMDHDDCVVEIPKGFHTDASSLITQHAMICHPEKQIYLIQFHPERYDTVPESGVFFDNFIQKVMGKKLSLAED
jgi:GMP synthase (glutamine-hydrolysing)